MYINDKYYLTFYNGKCFKIVIMVIVLLISNN